MMWNKKDIGREIVRELSQRYKIDALTASVLARRGIVEGEDLLFWLEDDIRFLHNPFLFRQMEDAVDRIMLAKDEGEKVLIFGDRDVDGITSTTLLFNALVDLGLDVSWRLPTGNDPYGLTIQAVEDHASAYGTLIITVDCGITCHEEIALAARLGVDVIVVDHHNPRDTLPEAVAIINPKIPDSGYPFRDLAGCAVTWKLITALRLARTELYKQQMCILNVRPLNDAFIIEAIKIENMCETQRISETVIPGMISITQTRLLPFLQGQQILVWDAAVQTKQLKTAFGPAVEFNILDIAPEVGRTIPAVRGMSLLRLKDLSKIAQYSSKPVSEIDGFLNILISFMHKRNGVYGKQETQEIQLVALGTLADLMPLTNENRILVKQGLAAMNTNPLPGLSQLFLRQNLAGKHIATSDLAWLISPAINATGRMGCPQKAVQLLVSTDPAQQSRLADEIIQLNTDRKQLGTDGWNIIEPLARDSLSRFNQNLVLAASGEVNRGVTGIMANRLCGVFKVPSIVMCMMEDGTYVGSMRSARGLHLSALLDPLADLFIDHGGHAFAAGFSLKPEKIAEFEQRLERLSAVIEFPENSDSEELIIDAELPHTFLEPGLLTLVDRFEPYGEGNEPLLFTAKKLSILTADIMGKTEKQHLKLTFDCGIHKWPAVFWQAADRYKQDFEKGDRVDAVFQIGRNTWNGTITPQMILKDIKRSD